MSTLAGSANVTNPKPLRETKSEGMAGGWGGVVMRIRAKGRSHKNKPLGPPPSSALPRSLREQGRPAPTPAPLRLRRPLCFLLRAGGMRRGEPSRSAPRVRGDAGLRFRAGTGGCGSTRPDRNSRSLSARAGWAAVLPGALGGGVPHDHTLPNFSEFAKIVSKAVCGERAERERRVRDGGARAGPGRRDAAHAGRDTRGEGAAGGGYLVRFAS